MVDDGDDYDYVVNRNCGCGGEDTISADRNHHDYLLVVLWRWPTEMGCLIPARRIYSSNTAYRGTVKKSVTMANIAFISNNMGYDCYGQSKIQEV